MSDHKEHIIHYSAADIQRYVQGKMSAREMHAMEKAALDDPFLADAMEGMQEAFTTHNEKLVTGQLQQLQQQFQTRTFRAKVVAFTPFRYWQVAAAVIVIIAGVWIYSLVADPSAEKNSAPVIAKTEKKKLPQPETAPALTDSVQRSPVANATPPKSVVNQKTVEPSDWYRNKNADEQVLTKTNPAEAAPVSSGINKSALSRSTKMDSVTSLDKNYAQSSEEKDKEIVARQETAPPVASAITPELKKRKESTYNNANLYRDRETELITIPRNDSPKKTLAFNNNNLSGVIKGQVTDQNNNPIANAYVQITKENNNILTDKTGFFKLPVSDSVVDIAVNVTGYGTQNFRLQNNTGGINQLQLQPANAALNEVAITPSQYNKFGLGSKLPNNIIHEAAPVGGWIAFDQYLEKNKKAPASNAAATSGQVIVSFEVNKKGILSAFKIEQSLSKAYDEEAIRLISQGPAWKMLKKGRKARVTVMVRF
jgi:hypothetical protein